LPGEAAGVDPTTTALDGNVDDVSEIPETAHAEPSATQGTHLASCDLTFADTKRMQTTSMNMPMVMLQLTVLLLPLPSWTTKKQVCHIMTTLSLQS